MSPETIHGYERIIHPVSPLRPSERLVFERGLGFRLWTSDGHEYVDAVSGLWNVAIGYGRKELAQSAHDAIERFGFASLYFSQAHDLAARLADKLASLTPSGIERFFFTSEGSTAVDSAIKFVRFENVLRGRAEKTKIIARWKSYHGSSLGSGRVTGQQAYWDGFGPSAPGILHIGQPPVDDPNSTAELERALEAEGAETVAALIAEPVSLPAGVALPGDLYWPRVREICTAFDVRLIADEVVTGFGRTGTFFAMERWGVIPDLVILSKGLTSGYVPLAAVGVSEAVYDGLAGHRGELMHGFTTSGHPVCAAVALANIDIIERERLVENAREVGEYFADVLRQLVRRHTCLSTVRTIGMLAGIDVQAGATDEQGNHSPPIVQEARRRRLLIRGYENNIVLAPYLAATRQEIDEIAERLSETLVETSAEK